MPSGHQALRRGRHSAPGQVYLVTFATRARLPHFASFDTGRTAARALATAGIWTQSTLLTWVLMPDHWHGLFVLGTGESLSDTIRRLKGASARELRLRHPQLEGIWAPAYHDRALRAEKDIRDAARYVVMNPVRAGLVRQIADYPFWDAVWLQARG